MPPATSAKRQRPPSVTIPSHDIPINPGDKPRPPVATPSGNSSPSPGGRRGPHPETITIAKPPLTLGVPEGSTKTVSRRLGAPRVRKRRWPYVLIPALLLTAVAAVAVSYETQTSTLQAKYLSLFAAKLKFHVAAGKVPTICAWAMYSCRPSSKNLSKKGLRSPARRGSATT